MDFLIEETLKRCHYRSGFSPTVWCSSTYQELSLSVLAEEDVPLLDKLRARLQKLAGRVMNSILLEEDRFQICVTQPDGFYEEECDHFQRTSEIVRFWRSELIKGRFFFKEPMWNRVEKGRLFWMTKRVPFTFDSSGNRGFETLVFSEPTVRIELKILGPDSERIPNVLELADQIGTELSVGRMTIEQGGHRTLVRPTLERDYRG